jgi:uncharacterized protein involved in exopolysaccharide biosynthesis
MARMDLIRDLAEKIRISFVYQSRDKDRVSVSLTHHKADWAQEIPNALVKNYEARTIQVAIDELNRKKGYLSKQVKAAKQELEDLEEQLDEYVREHASMRLDDPAGLQREIDNTKREIRERMFERKRAIEKRKRAIAQREAMRPTTQPATRPAAKASEGTAAGAQTQPAVATATGPATRPAPGPVAEAEPFEWVEERNQERRRLENEIRKYEQQLDQARTLSHMTDKHPTVRTLKAKIADLERRLAAEPEWVTVQRRRGVPRSANVDPRREELVLRMLEADIAAAQKDIETFDAELEKLRLRLAEQEALAVQAGPIEREYQRLISEVGKKKRELNSFSEALTETEASLSQMAAEHGLKIKAVELAQEQYRPSSPTLMKILGMALAAGLAVAAGIVFLVNTLDPVIRTTEDATRYFDVPVHGAIAEITTPIGRAMSLTRRYVLLPAMVVLCVAGVVGSAILVDLWLYDEETYNRWRPAALISGALPMTASASPAGPSPAAAPVALPSDSP